MSTIAPARSLAQRQEALERANEIRTLRADLKRDLKGHRRTLWDVLACVAGDAGALTLSTGATIGVDELASMRLFDLLLAAPKVGRVKANTIVQRARISPSKSLGGLTYRQRYALANVLRAYPSLRR
jgi:hypothetical protein